MEMRWCTHRRSICTNSCSLRYWLTRIVQIVGLSIQEMFVLHFERQNFGSFLYFRTKIRAGEHKISNQGPDCSNETPPVCNVGVQDFDVEKILYHPDYNSPNVFQNDIAIVKLDRKVSRNGKGFKWGITFFILMR